MSTAKVTQKAESFINTLHAIWLTDALSMDEYMDVQWTLMLRHGVRYKDEMDLDPDAVARLAQLRLSVDDLFAYDCNTYASDNYETFRALCLGLMDFNEREVSHA